MAAIGPREVGRAVWALGTGQLGRYGLDRESETDRFEVEMAEHFDVEHALAVNSGTSALVCALAAANIGTGDEVLVPAYTWISTAAAAVMVGAVPVLVDIDESLTMDPADLEAKITSRSKAVIVVHMLNLPADMNRIMRVARSSELFVIEDACQATGVSYEGRKLGSIGDAGTFSFNQHKNMTSGEGGALLTNDERIDVRARAFHDVGSYMRPGRLEHAEQPFVGMNLRMPELSSAILRPQLRRLDRQMARRAKRRAMMIDLLESRQDLTFSPHNDEANAVGLSCIFETAEDAKAFAGARGANRLIDTGRHVHTSWTPLIERRTYDRRANPWTSNDVDYADSCARTIDILSRSCSISLDPHLPEPVLRRFGKMMATSPSVRSPRAPVGDTSPAEASAAAPPT